MLVVMFASLLFTQAGSAFISGKNRGCLTTLRRSASIVIISDNPVLIEGQTQTGDIYSYAGYFLLFTDKDNYYLFRDINPDTLKPKSYFVVSKDVLKTVQITELPISEDENEKYSGMCIKGAKDR